MEAVEFARLINRIAHELRSPLTSLKGFSATLIKRWDRFTDDQRLQFVETIHSDSERMARIIAEMLDIARYEGDRLELNQQPVEVEELVSNARKKIESREGAERVSTQVPKGLMANVDAERVTSVIMNLLENGIKFSEDGPVELSARKADGMVEITVRDSGVGIEAERLPGVFDGPGPHGQRSGPFGTGLGLFLAQRLVTAHGGTITVASEQGSGSTFTVVLPGA